MILTKKFPPLPPVRPKPRASIPSLFPQMRKHSPRRCHISGETEKNQTVYPAPWMNQHKDFLTPKKYPLEIDHIDGVPHRTQSWDLRWLTKLHHIERTNQQMFPYRRKVLRAAPTRRPGYVFSWE